MRWTAASFATLLALVAARAVAQSSRPQLADLRNFYDFVIGPGSIQPNPNWTEERASKPPWMYRDGPHHGSCRCHDICRITTDGYSDFEINTDGPGKYPHLRTYRGQKCGWQGYSISRDFRDSIGGRGAAAEREFLYGRTAILRRYGEPTYAIAGNDGYHAVTYCTTLEGHVLAPAKRRTARESFRYEFSFDAHDNLWMLSVAWVKGCGTPYPPFRPIP